MRSKEGNLNISEIIGRKIQDNPYYDSKNNEKIRLIGFGLIGKKDEIERYSFNYHINL